MRALLPQCSPNSLFKVKTELRWQPAHPETSENCLVKCLTAVWLASASSSLTSNALRHSAALPQPAGGLWWSATLSSTLRSPWFSTVKLNPPKLGTVEGYFPNARVQGGSQSGQGGIPSVSGVRSVGVEPRAQYQLWPFILGHAGTARISESRESTSKNYSSLNTSLAAMWGFVLSV